MIVCANCGHASADGFKFCPECGAPHQASAPAREVRKVVTIVFCDLTGSTALGDRTDPEALRSTMRGYYEEMRTILERHGGTVEKFVGDAVMAVFGVPVSREDDALRAVRAAWEMRTAVGALGLQARIGLNTGEVVAGEGDTLVTGDAVNVAARLEQAAEPGDVLIGDTTRRLVRDAVVVEPLEIRAKGKPQPVAAFRLLELDLDASGVARNLDAPLVGRRRELALLQQAYEQTVTEKSCQLFTLLGTAGVGKSRLVAELLDGLDATVVRGRCIDYAQGVTLWPIIEVLKQLGADDTVTRITGSLGSSNELFLTVRKRLEEAAAERPIVVVFEDIHWGEPTFLDLVEHISDLSRGVPLLLLCIARPELLDERPAWAGGKLNATTTLLEPLSREDSHLLLSGLADEVVDASTEARILDAAAGNPLFVEEMLALVREGGDVRAPSTVQALLQARLDRLGASERSVIERGAVEGEIFHRGAVADLQGKPVDAELAGLVRKELVRPDRGTFPGEDAYRFRHVLVRDAAYDSLPKETRADLHTRFADWLEQHRELVELDEILGYHLERAAGYLDELGRPSADLGHRGGLHLAAAGRKAAARSDHAAAANLLARSAALLTEAQEACGPILLNLAEAFIELGRFDDSDRTLATVLSLPDLRQRAHGRLLKATSAFNRDAIGATDPAVALLGEVVPQLEAERDTEGLMRAATLEFWVHWTSSCAGPALEAAERIYELAGELGDARQRIWALSWRGIAIALGPFSYTRIAEVAAKLEAAGPGGRHALLNVRAYESLFAGDLDTARAHFREAVAETSALGMEVSTLGLTMVGASIEAVAERYDTMIDLLVPAVRRLDELGATSYGSTICAYLARAYYGRGQPDEALAAADAAEARSAQEDAINFIATHGLRARVHADRGELARAKEFALSALRYAEGMDMPVVRGEAYLSLATVLRASGDAAGAKAALLDARAEFAIKEFGLMLERVDALLSQHE